MRAKKTASPHPKKQFSGVRRKIQQIRLTVEQRYLTRRAILMAASMLIVVFGIVAGVGLSKAWNQEPEIIARVNGEPVSRGELRRCWPTLLWNANFSRSSGSRRRIGKP